MEAMLDLISDAALLVDARNRLIQMANTKAAEVTAFTRAELVGMRLNVLFEKLDEASLWNETDTPAEPVPFAIFRRNKSKLEVAVQRHELGASSGWSVISFKPLVQLQQKRAREARRGEMMGSMLTIIQAIKETDLATALDMLLKAAGDITGSSMMSIYLQEIGRSSVIPEVIRFAHVGPPEPLPGSLPAQELVQLRNAHLWVPGKRPATTIHRSARAAGLGYVATAPLGQPKAMIGFLLAASEDPAPSEAILQQIKMVADVASTLIETHSKLTSLQSLLDDEKRLSVGYHVIENAVEDGLVALTSSLNIQHINQAAEQMLGYSKNEARGHPVQNILVNTGGLAPALQLALEGITTYKEENIHFYRRSGQPFHARTSVIPVKDNNQISGIVILFQDLSGAEQIQVQAQQLEQRALLGEVTAIFAHEVRNPINNISTGLQLMAYNLKADDPHQELINRLQQDCDRLNELMKSVLAFSRPMEYEMEPVDIGGLLSRLVERLKPRMQRVRVEPLVQIEPALPKVRGNPRALEQVFTNLVTNAIQAMNENGGTVAVKIQQIHGGGNRSQIQVDIADNGPGISQELQDKLFQPFFTTKIDGTGLGLPITKRIVTAHKGTIQVTSFPGGTVFHVSLPIMENE